MKFSVPRKNPFYIKIERCCTAAPCLPNWFFVTQTNGEGTRVISNISLILSTEFQRDCLIFENYSESTLLLETVLTYVPPE